MIPSLFRVNVSKERMPIRVPVRPVMFMSKVLAIDWNAKAVRHIIIDILMVNNAVTNVMQRDEIVLGEFVILMNVRKTNLLLPWFWSLMIMISLMDANGNIRMMLCAIGAFLKIIISVYLLPLKNNVCI